MGAGGETGTSVPLTASQRRWLAVILLVALAVRLYPVALGAPRAMHPDEPLTLVRALRMAATGDPNPRWFAYPPLSFYLHAGVFRIVRMVRPELPLEPPGAGEWGPLLSIARSTVALVGTATVLVTFLAARALLGIASALAAALVLALTFLHVQQSQVVKPEALSGLLAGVALWCTARALGTGADRWLAGAGAAAGLAAATKYNAVLCALLPLGALAALPPPRRALARATLVALAAAGAFVLAVPWVVLDRQVLDSALSMASAYRRGLFVLEQLPSWWFYLGYLWSDGLTPGLAAAVVLGLVVLAVTDRARAVALLLFPLCYYALLASVRVRADRNLVPLLPVLAVLGGHGLATAWRWLSSAGGAPPWRHAAAVPGVLLCLVWPLGRIVLHDHYLAAADTLAAAGRWMDENVPAGATVCVDPLLAPSKPSLTVVPFGIVIKRPLTRGEEARCDWFAVTARGAGRALRDPRRYAAFAPLYQRLLGRVPAATFRYTDSRLVRAVLGRDFVPYSPDVLIFRRAAGAGPGSDQGAGADALAPTLFSALKR